MPQRSARATRRPQSICKSNCRWQVGELELGKSRCSSIRSNSHDPNYSESSDEDRVDTLEIKSLGQLL